MYHADGENQAAPERIGKNITKGNSGKKRIPNRTCVACRQTKPKRDLVRVVRSPDGSVHLDETGKAHGRGSYVCKSRVCWEKALDNTRRAGGLLAVSLKATPSEADMSVLFDYARQLPDE